MNKLNAEKVFKIKQDLQDGKPQKQIAEEQGVSPATITKIKQGKIYKYIVVPSKEFSRGYELGFKDGTKRIR